MKDTLILKDGTAIGLEAESSIEAMQVLSADKASMVSTWDKMTKDNLSSVQIKSGGGEVIGNDTDLLLVSEISVVRENGNILTTYNLRKKTETEKIMERLDAVEEGQQEQVRALSSRISDLEVPNAEMTIAMADMIGGAI